MRDRVNIEEEILRVIGPGNHGGILLRLADWLALQPDDELTYAIQFIVRNSQKIGCTPSESTRENVR